MFSAALQSAIPKSLRPGHEVTPWATRRTDCAHGDLKQSEPFPHRGEKHSLVPSNDVQNTESIKQITSLKQHVALMRAERQTLTILQMMPFGQPSTLNPSCLYHLRILLQRTIDVKKQIENKKYTERNTATGLNKGVTSHL